MTSISERLLELQRGKERYSFAVSKLGPEGGPLTIFYTELTVREDTKLRKDYPNFYSQLTSGEMPSFAALVDLLILKALNEDGTKTFSQEDRSYLLGMSVKFITDIAAKLLEHLFPEGDVEQAEKNS